MLIDSKQNSHQKISINSDNNFTIVANPSESKDINQDIENELLSITDLG